MSSLYTNEIEGIDKGTLNKAKKVLEQAKNTELNKRRTVAKKVGENHTVFITPEQDNDPSS